MYISEATTPAFKMVLRKRRKGYKKKENYACVGRGEGDVQQKRDEKMVKLFSPLFLPFFLWVILCHRFSSRTTCANAHSSIDVVR